MRNFVLVFAGLFRFFAVVAEVAQLVEHTHGKGEVPGSIPGLGSRIKLNGFLDAEMRAARSATLA